VAKGVSEPIGVPGVMFCGPAVLPHQLQVATRVLGAAGGQLNCTGVK
jgi:hypothetical protein